jgi:hypothetical protein
MPWREHLDPQETELISHPDARIHHLGHARATALLQAVVIRAISAANPSLGNSPRAVVHQISQPGHPLYPFYGWAHSYIESAISTLDAHSGDHVKHASEWIDDHARELMNGLRRYLGR